MRQTCNPDYWNHAEGKPGCGETFDDAKQSTRCPHDPLPPQVMVTQFDMNSLEVLGDVKFDIPLPREACPHEACTVMRVHSHGTDARYLPRAAALRDQTYSIAEEARPPKPKPGSLNALLYAAFLAGRDHAFGHVSASPDATLFGFEQWRQQHLAKEA